MATHQIEQDESYFVSMTDLMVGMLFIFIILLMAFALNLKEQETKLSQTEAQLNQTNDARTEMLRDIESALRKKGIPVIVLPESGVLRLPEQVLFDVGRADLQPKGKEAVAKLAEALQQVLPCYAGADRHAQCAKKAVGRLESVFIEGHTDNQLVAGNAEGNWRLSYDRAQAVYRQLILDNPVIAQLRNDRESEKGAGERLLGLSGYADQRPVADNNTAAGQQANRRIDLRFIMAVPNPKQQAAIDNALTPSSSSK